MSHLRVKCICVTYAHMTAKKTAAMNMRIDPQVRADIAALAQSQDRSLANYVERILKAHIEAEKAKAR